MALVYSGIILVNSSHETSAKDIVLFRNDEPVANYDETVKRIRPGDRLIFSDGQSRVVGPFLGEGGSALVFDLPPDRVLKIPLSSERVGMNAAFILGYHELKHGPLPIPKVYLERSSLSGEYIEVEKVKIQFKLSDVLHPGRRRELIKARKIRNLDPIWSQLEVFFERAATYRMIGDMDSSNLGWNGREWVLFDWFLGTEAAVATEDTFGTSMLRITERSSVPPKVKKRLIDAAHRGRKNCLKSLESAAAPE